MSVTPLPIGQTYPDSVVEQSSERGVEPGIWRNVFH